MAVVTICSDFVDPHIKYVTISTVFASVCHEVMGQDAMMSVNTQITVFFFFLVCLVTIASYSFSFQEINLLVSLFSISNIIFTIFVSCSIFCILFIFILTSVQIRSVTHSCPTLWDPMHNSMSSLPDHHQLPEFTQTHVHQVSDAI